MYDIFARVHMCVCMCVWVWMVWWCESCPAVTRALHAPENVVGSEAGLAFAKALTVNSTLTTLNLQSAW